MWKTMTATLQPVSMAPWATTVGTTPSRSRTLDEPTTDIVTETITPTLPTPPFAAIVDEHGPAVYRLAKSVVRDSALAEDVAQETFIKVWKHLETFRGDGSLRGWILRIAHNQAVSTLRRIRDSATDPSRLPDAVEPITVSRVVEGRLAASELMDALDQLDELSRAIVVLREVEGLSYDDIAATLDVPIPTVKTRLLRARRELARNLADWRVTS
jgi:RNA polymerase sigma-70 factor (ECF subfamily)